MILEEFKEVCRKYDGRAAIERLDLKVREGQVLSVIGPNGSGKTTLLRMMALLDKPTGGEIYYRGEKVNDSNINALRNKVTMVFQSTANFKKSVYKNVAYGLELRNVPENEINRSVMHALKLVEMKKYVDRGAKKLSGGEQQRVAIARALVFKPKLLLLDEPTANLDPKNTLTIERIIRKVRKKTTVVIATNNPFQASRLSDRVVCLLDGNMIMEGTPKEIVNNPKDERIKHFVRGEL